MLFLGIFFSVFIATNGFHSSRIPTAFSRNAYRDHSRISDVELLAPIVRTNYNFEEDFKEDDTWWLLFSPPKAQTPSSSQSRSGLDASCSFEVLSNNIKNINAVSNKLDWLPVTNAWRSLIPQEDEIITDIVPPSLSAYLSGRSVLKDAHNSRIMELWDYIQDRGSLSRLSSQDVEKVIEALRIAYVGLWGKKTARSMEESINRAKGIGAVLGVELQADVDVIIAGILHEVVSMCSADCEALNERVIQHFGNDVLDLTLKYVALPKFMARTSSYGSYQAENKIQMLVAVAEDYRSLYIRLADRIHTLRILHKLPLQEVERVKIAEEALNVYAPIAHKMGVMKIKGELEDLALSVIDPEMFELTKKSQTIANMAYNQIAEKINRMINTDPVVKGQEVAFRITSRIKDKYQLYLKMKRKNLRSLNDVKDALGLRVIIDAPRFPDESAKDHERRSHGICYHIMAKLEAIPGWMEDGFKDYISKPKPNGYQSVHVYMKSISLGTYVEVQVRTRDMHMKAELGDAAHWYYKDLIYRPEIANSKMYKYAWRSESQLKAKTPAELIGIAKQKLLKGRVFVLLEDRSTVLNLKINATCLDAAFAIHSKLGLSTSFVKVNGKPVEFFEPLKNLDVIAVEVAKSKDVEAVTAKQYWLSFVKTDIAISSLKRHFRDNHKGMLACIGCVQIVMAITLNAESILKKIGEIPTVERMDVWSVDRLQMHNLGDLLIRLGSASPSEAADIFGKLFDMSPSAFNTPTINHALAWAKMQGLNGWHDTHIRDVVLLPLLRDLLPKVGLKMVEKRWCELIGPKSLTDEQSPYFKALSSRLISSRELQSDKVVAKLM